MKIRFAGLLLLGLCALAAWGLHQLAIAPPRHEATALELLSGMLAFLCGSAGAAMTLLGRALLARVPTPPRPWRVAPRGR
jgi:hypothetical protein